MASTLPARRARYKAEDSMAHIKEQRIPCQRGTSSEPSAVIKGGSRVHIPRVIRGTG